MFPFKRVQLVPRSRQELRVGVEHISLQVILDNRVCFIDRIHKGLLVAIVINVFELL